MWSLSASHVAKEVHVVRTATVHVVMTAEVTVAHVAMTKVQEVHVVSVLLRLQNRTTSQRCSNRHTYIKKGTVIIGGCLFLYSVTSGVPDVT